MKSSQGICSELDRLTQAVTVPQPEATTAERQAVTLDTIEIGTAQTPSVSCQKNVAQESQTSGKITRPHG